MPRISDLIQSRLVIGYFRPAKTEPDHGLPVPASLVLKEVANLLKRLFAPSVAQDSSFGEKSSSIILELNRDGVELTIKLSVVNELLHIIVQAIEDILLLIFLDCSKNLWLQFRPFLRHIHAESIMGRRATTLYVGGGRPEPQLVTSDCSGLLAVRRHRVLYIVSSGVES